MSARIFDDTPCQLGEGVLWHPQRSALFWVDIERKTLYSKGNGATTSWSFAEHVSAAGWIDTDRLLIASASALLRFDLDSGATQTLCPLEADNPITRSNDGRADPWGGFWIGTMGRNAETHAGAIYRYFRGELRQLYAALTIPNAICFCPDRRFGYFADTALAKVWRQALNATDGWPVGEPEVFLDLTGTGINPDGAVCDARGYFWNAQWGGARLARYSPDGEFDHEIALPTDHITCPGFGGPNLCTLYATSALQGLSAAKRATQPEAGKTFCIDVTTPGQKEHQVVL